MTYHDRSEGDWSSSKYECPKWGGYTHPGGIFYTFNSLTFPRKSL